MDVDSGIIDEVKEMLARSAGRKRVETMSDVSACALTVGRARICTLIGRRLFCSCLLGLAKGCMLWR